MSTRRDVRFGLRAAGPGDDDLLELLMIRPTEGSITRHPLGEATFMSAALQRAGFGEVGTVWQWLDNRVLVAILGDAERARLV